MTTLLLVYKSSTGVVTTPVEEVIFDPREFPGVIIFSSSTKYRCKIKVENLVAIVLNRGGGQQ